MESVFRTNRKLTMKKMVFVVILFCSDVLLLAQIEPIQNNDTLISELNLKAISSCYYASKDTAIAEATIVFKKEFDRHGKVMNKYILSLWEGVSYENVTTFRYDKKSQPIEESMSQRILNLGKRDQQYIDSFGNTPLNEIVRYAYNQDGDLVEKNIFTFSMEELSTTAKPSQKIRYEYDSGMLKSELSSSPNSRIFNKNFTIDYQYDSLKNLIRKIITYGTDMDKKRVSKFTYNLENLLIEEKVEDSGIPRNNAHFKYTYNESGLLKGKLYFDLEEEDFVVNISYEYDEHGYRIAGEKEVDFTYYANGLIRTELWKDEVSDLIFFFVSKYEFY